MAHPSNPRKSYFCMLDSANLLADKNKMERFLRAGRFSIASIYAPVSFRPLPVIVLKRAVEDVAPAVAAIGSLKTIDPDRIILKRVILTGYPQRVSKRKNSVKHMFYNPEDVGWFKPVELYSKGGLRGRIKEPIWYSWYDAYIADLHHYSYRENQASCLVRGGIHCDSGCDTCF